METGSGADASGCGGVAVGNKANGVGAVRSIDASNAASGVSDAVGVGGCDDPEGWERRDDPEGSEGWEGQDGCEKEQMLLDHRTRTLAPGVISTISTSEDLLVFWLTTVMLLKFV